MCAHRPQGELAAPAQTHRHGPGDLARVPVPRVVRAAPAHVRANGPEGWEERHARACAPHAPRVSPWAVARTPSDSEPRGGAWQRAAAGTEALPHAAAHQLHSLHAPSLASALAERQLPPQSAARRDELAACKTAFCVHQIEVCQQFESYVHQFYTPLRTEALVDVAEVCGMLDPIRSLVQLHRELLERLQRDSDMVAREPRAKSHFCSVVHDVFADMRGPFKIYMENFDDMFDTYTKWNATSPRFARMLQERDSKLKLNLASSLALPLTCLKTYQEILQQYRLALQQCSTQNVDGGEEAALVDQTMLAIRSMRDRASVHGATDQAVKSLLSIEKKMVSLAVCDTAGAVISIVKLGRAIVHIGALRVLKGAGGAGGDEEHGAEYTGYLFSDMLVCCGGHKGGLVARLIVDLKMAEVETYEGPWHGDDGSTIHAHAFGVHQTDRKAAGHERFETRCTDFATSDAASRNVWLAKLRECLSSLAAAKLRMPPLSIDEIQRLRRVSKDLIHELGLFAYASDTTEDGGRYGTSASDSEWDVEDAVEESGLMAGLRKARESSRLKGLTADKPEFQSVLEQKLLRLQLLSGRVPLETVSSCTLGRGCTRTKGASAHSSQRPGRGR